MTTGIFSRIFACTPGDLAYPTHSPPDAGRRCRRSRQWEAGGLGGRTCPQACVPTITPHTPSPLKKIRFAWHTPSPLDLYVRSSPSLVPLARPAIARTHPDTPPDGDAGRDARGPDALLVNHRREGFRTGGAPRPIAQPDCKTLRLARDRQETRGQRRVHEPGGGG